MVGLTNRQPKAEQADNRMKCYYDIEHATSCIRYTLIYTTLRMAMAERNTIFFEMFDSDTVFLLPWQNMTNYLGGSQQIVASTLISTGREDTKYSIAYITNFIKLGHIYCHCFSSCLQN